ncbi:DUF4336 domain-containing protein [Pacificimonas flava]|uniref:DUF4336 domain-containing protein n=2 Tax=Pacificimonas TaxID=1960290 RepID=A0A219B4M7_9SPHN|nr:MULTISPECIES: DUF4336 domain-containing protein [Pacificimonas]MBZ6379477.1 DUF4336 domain-containing protein [Pacificimonas aurantium]OWV33332.1 DUF4336 domain-containing protein [Pacificimonas flava]
MTDLAFQPYEPLNEPKPFGPNIWIVDGPEIRMDYGPVELPFPTRMTIIRLADGRLWLHSPTQPSEALFSAIDALGTPAFLLAPNSIHYWYVPDWHARYPQAELFGVPGLSETAKRPLPSLRALGAAAPHSWAGEIEQVLVPGTAVTEAVFFHRESRTTILCDLIENFEPVRVRSWWLRLLLRLAGAADPDGKAPFDLQLTFRPKITAVRRALHQVLGWDTRGVIMSHGRPYPRDGRAELRRAFRWAVPRSA